MHQRPFETRQHSFKPISAGLKERAGQLEEGPRCGCVHCESTLRLTSLQHSTLEAVRRMDWNHSTGINGSPRSMKEFRDCLFSTLRLLA